MSEPRPQKTYNGFTKFVLWATIAVIVLLDFSYYITLINKYKNDN